MINDLVAALREAREFVRKRYLTMGDKEANELIARIDVALAISRPPPSEASYVGMETFDEQTIDGVRVMSEAPKAKP